jgi:hypothetical protein
MSDQMNIGVLEQAMIDKHGFLVTMSGHSYVVRDPSVKKRKHEGGNLMALLVAAEMDREERQKKAAVKKPAANTPAAKQPAANPVKLEEDSEKVIPGTAEEPAAPDEIVGATLDDTNNKPTRKTKPPTEKRKPADWTTGRVGMLILRNTDKTPEAILKMCDEQNIKTTKMTVVGLSRYFRLCITLLAQIAEEDAQAKAS